MPAGLVEDLEFHLWRLIDMDAKTGDLGSGCPYNQESKGRSLLGRQNKDWWPEALPVDILTQGGLSPDPMGSDFNYAEAFNARVRAECLDQAWFMDLDDARRKVEDWRVEYNEVRPHSAIGDRPPMALLAKALEPSEAAAELEPLT